MLRALILFLVLAIPAAPGGSVQPELAQQLLRFHKHYDAFFRAFFGCPERAVDPAECSPGQGRIDYAEALKAAKADPFPGMLPR